jgi:hypothetical protein
MARKPPQMTVGKVLLADFANFLLALLPVIISYFFSFALILGPLQSIMGLYAFIFVPLILPFIFIATVFIFRLLIPKLKEGIYPTDLNLGTITWMLHLQLARSVELSLIKNLLFSFGTTRYLLLRALGAKIPYKMMGSLGLSFTDCPLIEIGENTNLNEGVAISAHTSVGDKLWLKKVVIGSNVYVGAFTLVGPGSNIGNDTWIGPYNRIMMDRLEPESKLEAFEWDRGNPDKKHNKK